MKKMHHIVLVQFRSGKDHRAAELLSALDALRATIPGFLSIGGGPYSSPEGLNQGYTFGLLMTFASAQVRDQYLVHPDHERVKQSFLPDVEKVVAFDFEADGA